MLINAEQLKEWTGKRQRGALVRWLNAHGVPYWTASNGDPVTTEAAINARLLGADGEARDVFDFGARAEV